MLSMYLFNCRFRIPMPEMTISCLIFVMVSTIKNIHYSRTTHQHFRYSCTMMRLKYGIPLAQGLIYISLVRFLIDW